MVSDDGIGISVEVVHEHVGAFDGLGSWGGLFGSDFVEGRKDTGVAGAAIVHKGAVDGLDAGGALLVKRLSCGLRGSALGLA